jgi:Fic family protein
MPWNWELPNWPHFHCDPSTIAHLERKFLLGIGSSFAFLKNISPDDQYQFTVEILSIEGQLSSKIEGELLERESLRSSIRKQFNLQNDSQNKNKKEFGMAEALCDVYKNYNQPLTHQMLWEWHRMLFKNWASLEDVGSYRKHLDPMQIVSGRLDEQKIFYEAPPSAMVPAEMAQFIKWYNLNPSGSILARASIAHLYFESIHPFEDGNGRIGRLLVEKVLSQGLGKPVLIAVSKCIEQRKKDYYAELARCNETLEIQQWIEFFAELIVQAQEESMQLLQFLLAKSKMLTQLAGKINPRQEKVLVRMFTEGPEGFIGGLSAEKYIAITKASRATTTRDLADLVEKGALIKTGELRHTRYKLNLSEQA